MQVVGAEQIVRATVVVHARIDRSVLIGEHMWRPVDESIVGIRQVARRGGEERYGGGCAAPWRSHEEEEVIFGILRAQVCRIDPALQPPWYGPFKIGGPVSVLQVVVMEVNRAVFAGRSLKVGFGAAPIVSRHRASGHVVDSAVKFVGRFIRHAVTVKVSAEIPCRDHSLGVISPAAVLDRLDFVSSQGPGEESRRFDLAVVVSGSHESPAFDARGMRCDDERRVSESHLAREIRGSRGVRGLVRPATPRDLQNGCAVGVGIK